MQRLFQDHRSCLLAPLVVNLLSQSQSSQSQLQSQMRWARVSTGEALRGIPLGALGHSQERPSRAAPGKAHWDPPSEDPLCAPKGPKGSPVGHPQGRPVTRKAHYASPREAH